MLIGFESLQKFQNKILRELKQCQKIPQENCPPKGPHNLTVLTSYELCSGRSVILDTKSIWPGTQLFRLSLAVPWSSFSVSDREVSEFEANLLKKQQNLTYFLLFFEPNYCMHYFIFLSNTHELCSDCYFLLISLSFTYFYFPPYSNILLFKHAIYIFRIILNCDLLNFNQK